MDYLNGRLVTAMDFKLTILHVCVLKRGKLLNLVCHEILNLEPLLTDFYTMVNLRYDKLHLFTVRGSKLHTKLHNKQ